jgi:hypothetical protein
VVWERGGVALLTRLNGLTQFALGKYVIYPKLLTSLKYTDKTLDYEDL